jgi:hypothetical protein
VANATPLTYADVANPLAQGVLSESELAVIEAKKKALDKVFQEAGKAKYKVEVMFSKDFSLQKPSVGAVTFWESGAKLHGGGDAGMHICPGKKLGVSNCEAFITDAGHGLDFLVCPSCHQQWRGDQVYGQVLARLSVGKWADVLLSYFHKLQGDVDLCMKYYPGSLREASGKEQARQRFGEELDTVRNQRQIRVYPMKNIIKDISSGADLRGRILAFLKA